MKREYYYWLTILTLLLVSLAISWQSIYSTGNQRSSWWHVQSIDTMKFSRDMSREKLKDITSFAIVIETQVAQISHTGATHVAIATPYDEEFFPILTLWVETARKHNLNVWFRGNWSGWETWFGYPKIDRSEHQRKTQEFIEKHPDIFKDGDIFTACPECENGGPGDPRRTGDVAGFRQFLITEYRLTKDAFDRIGKKVTTNYNSMNGDVARLVMNPATTKDTGGVVTIDHYVKTSEKLIQDIEDIARSAQAEAVVLGEFGAPIPDINGKMTEEDQSQWLEATLTKLSQTITVTGVNYWTNMDSSTALWKPNGSPRQAVATLTRFFSPRVVSGKVTDEIGRPLAHTTILTVGKSVTTDTAGRFTLPILAHNSSISAYGPGFKGITFTIAPDQEDVSITLAKTNESIVFRLIKHIFRFFNLRPLASIDTL